MSAPRVVAVTGASGLIGRRVLPLLVNSSEEVRVLSRGPREAEPRVRVVRGDLLDATALHELLHGADAVVHLAGMAHTTLRNRAEYDHAFAVNVTGTRELLNIAMEEGVRRALVTSSAHVYAGQRGVNLNEDSPTAGDEGYGGMKLMVEQAAIEAMQRGLSMAVLRPCLTYGPGVRHNLPALLRAVRSGYYVQVRGAKTLRSMASVDTVATAVQHLLARAECMGPYNIADREPVVLEEWVNDLAAMMNVRPPRALPLALIRAFAHVGTFASKLKLPAPLTRPSLAKLTTPYSLATDKLAASGFVWPENSEAVVRQMIDTEFQ